MIGIGLVGAGYAGRMQLRGWRAVPDARIVGIWNRTPERARVLAEAFGVPQFDDLEVLLQHPDLDAVDIATAVDTHLDFARSASAAGKHVLCQKPLAPTYAEAEILVRTCAEAKVRLMVNENWRWRPWYRAAHRVLAEGSLGRHFHLCLTYRKSMAVTTPERPPERIFEQQPFLRAMKPLILMEMGPHHCDLVNYLFGEPKDVYARTHKVTSHVAGEEVATLILGYPDRTAIVNLSWASVGYPGEPHPDVLVVEGTEGTLRLGADGQVQLTYRDGRQHVVVVDTKDAVHRSWIAPLAHFAACLDRDEPFEIDGAQSLTTLGVVFAAYQSAVTEKPVDLVDALHLASQGP